MNSLYATEVSNNQNNFYFEGKFEKNNFHNISPKSMPPEIDKINSKKENVRIYLYEKILIAEKYIKDNLFSKMTVNQIAMHCGISEFHFSRIFKDVFGLSPYAYIIDLRLEKAKELIIKKSGSLSDIALQCGFNDLSHFSRYFKKKYKILPSKVKK